MNGDKIVFLRNVRRPIQRQAICRSIHDAAIVDQLQKQCLNALKENSPLERDQSPAGTRRHRRCSRINGLPHLGAHLPGHPFERIAAGLGTADDYEWMATRLGDAAGTVEECVNHLERYATHCAENAGRAQPIR